MLCNLWHIKQTNGLYYYALDYLRAVEPRMPVLVRPALFESTRRALPEHKVRSLSVYGLVVQLIGAILSGRWVFTPTSHPFPLLKRQLIVIHDDYPFLGQSGDFKRKVFRALLALSGCQVGHINYTTALRAIPDDLVPTARRWYMPNLGPVDADIDELRRRRQAASMAGSGRSFRVALFGTDSRKKRYELLFNAIRRDGRVNHFVFAVYGHPTAYYKELKAAFPDLSLELINSSETPMNAFLGGVDCVVSVAEHEGFGRPVALALAAGMSCFLLQSLVFEEFFGRSTALQPSVDELVAALACAANGSSAVGQGSATFSELSQIRAAFQAAAGQLSQIASGQGTLT